MHHIATVCVCVPAEIEPTCSTPSFSLQPKHYSYPNNTLFLSPDKTVKIYYIQTKQFILFHNGDTNVHYVA